MRVLDVIASALKNIGRRPLAETLLAGGTADDEETEVVNTMLYCFNAVEDEVARCYLPLVTKETLTSSNGAYSYSNFLHTPVRILHVFDGEKEIGYETYSTGFTADAEKVTVEFEYAPSKKLLTGYSDYWSGVAGEYLFACGAAAEYCLINGEIEAFGLWEEKYRQEIDAAQSRRPSSGGFLPPRRWA